MRTCRLAVVLALAAACHKGGAEADVVEPLAVRTAKVVRGDIADAVEASGTLSPLPGFDVKLAPIAPGRLAQVLVAEGDRVRQGQVLARLEATPLRDAEAQAEAQVAQARAQVSNAATKLDRARKAFEAGVAAGQEVDDARLQAEASRAGLRTAEAALSTARNQRQRGELRAPFDGVVARLGAAAGEPVDPSRVVVEVARVDLLELRAPLAPAVAMRVKPGAHAEVFVDASPGTAWPASVVAVAPVVDPATGATLVRLRVPNAAGALKAGTLARARVRLDEHAGALVIPREALLAEGDGAAVVVNEGGKARRVPVEVGFREDKRVEIRSGLAEGQAVVIQGNYAVPDGTPLAEEKPEPDAPKEGAPKPTPAAAQEKE